MIRSTAYTLGLFSAVFFAIGPLSATDHFITLGGGYEPSGNQASLEANVLFFRSVLVETHPGPRIESTFFADGNDDGRDLQVAVDPLPGRLAELLTKLHQRGGPAVEYRNHRVTDVAGPLRPENVRESLKRLAGSLTSGDRLIIYVTAHGESAKEDKSHNTYISCWNNDRFSAAEFTGWLDGMPENVPVILIMAQCYCGGFAHTLFSEANAENGLDSHLRCGFFAQQHDLPAAGCRPDIQNDEEYSSYFWGAFVGRSRNGKPLENVDSNGDGRVSFAEAHAQAIIDCDSIDIPLRTSEALVRYYSRIPGYEHRGAPETAAVSPANSSELLKPQGSLHAMQGTIRELSREMRVDVQATVRHLCLQLELDLDQPVSTVFERSSAHNDQFSESRRQLGRQRRGRNSERRTLRDAIAQQWPDLGDRRNWRQSPWLADEKQNDIMQAIKDIPSYSKMLEFDEQREAQARSIEQAELKSVRFQRLIGLLESSVLTRNLPLLATPEVVRQHQRVVALEESGWQMK